jgi:hypothetical protein
MYGYLRHRSWSSSAALLLSITAVAVATPAFAQSAPRNLRIVASSGAGVPSIRVFPDTAQLTPGEVVRFSPVVAGTTGQVLWTATGGTITSDGSYTAGVLSGTFSVAATIPGVAAGSATVTITGSGAVAIMPGQNIQSVVNSYPAGTTFLLKAGVHRHQTIAPRTGDSFVGETNGSTRLTILSGARVLTGWQFDGARWYVSGQTQGTTPAIGGDVACRPTHPRCSFAEDVFFDNVMKYHEDALAEVGPGEWFFDYAADRIYVGDNPAGRVVETSVTPFIFHGNGASNVTIQDVIIEKYASQTSGGAAQLGDSARGARNWLLTGSEVRWNHAGGIWLDSYTTARNNYVHHNCQFGFVGAGIDVIVEGNEIAYNNVMAGTTSQTCGYESFWAAGGSKWVYTTNMIVRGNFSHHNDGPGLWTDINNIYTLYENNIIEDNVRGGIFHEISYDAVIRHNTVRRNGTGKDYPWWTTGAGIEVVGSRNVEVYGNTLVDNWQGITGLNDHRGDGLHGPWVLTGLNVHNNNVTSRITAQGGGRTGVLDTAGSDAYQAWANNRFQGNAYILGPNASYFIFAEQNLNESQWRGYGFDTTGSFQR